MSQMKLISRSILIAILLPILAAANAARADEPLRSWNAGAAKTAILAFVSATTTQGSSDFVPPSERIAVFDNDGTLWSEQPIYFQFAYVVDRIKELAPAHPEWQQDEPFKSVIAGDIAAALAGGAAGLDQMMAVTHAGMTTEEFSTTVGEWLKTARHPRFDRPYNELTFRPMVELLTYLRANGYKTFIVSGGGVEFMRVWADQAYGIPPEQVIGSSGVVSYELDGDRPVLRKQPKVEFVDDGPGKPVGINRFIGRRPVFAAGNSDGDLQMLQWTTLDAGPRFGMIVHHTDAEREWAYDRTSHIGRLDKALDEALRRGWVVVDMKTDWNVIYPPQQP
jgi:phosphoglycolate phosphatase-like HAD superfamily hydrolase